jgi:uncharacterized surface protein with fasciclin (FAS1) repeats
VTSLHTLRISRGLAATAVAAAALGLTACGGSENSNSAAATPSRTSTAPMTSAASADAPFGPGCADVPASGPGSLAALATEPVASAAAQNPQLSTLVTAVTKAGLANTLNESSNITVFAPTNAAFAKIPKATLDQVLADRKALTNVLTYHVVGQRSTPTELNGATLTTLQGGTIRTTKDGDSYKVNDAKVVCGNIQTRNATVYVIDTVLMPKS